LHAFRRSVTLTFTDTRQPASIREPVHGKGRTKMQNNTAEGAISIKAFCERNGIGMTSAYAEIKAGRLIARKCGNRTLIAKADERAWLNSLPKLHTAAAAA
jgi:hypothetical protein